MTDVTGGPGTRGESTGRGGVVTATDIPGAGLTLHWYGDIYAAGLHAPTIWASAGGVMTGSGQYLTDVPPAWLYSALRVHRLLRSGTPASVAEARAMATHQRDGAGVVPVSGGAAAGDRDR